MRLPEALCHILSGFIAAVFQGHAMYRYWLVTYKSHCAGP